MKYQYLVIIIGFLGLAACEKGELAEISKDKYPLYSEAIVFNGLVHTPINNSTLSVSPDSLLVVGNFSDGGASVHLSDNCIWKGELSYPQVSGQELRLGKEGDSIELLLKIKHGSSSNGLYLAEGEARISAYLDSMLVFSRQITASALAPVVSYTGQLQTVYWTIKEYEETTVTGFIDTANITLSDGTSFQADKIFFSKSIHGIQPTTLQLSGGGIDQFYMTKSIAGKSTCGDVWEFDENIK